MEKKKKKRAVQILLQSIVCSVVLMKWSIGDERRYYISSINVSKQIIHVH